MNYWNDIVMGAGIVLLLVLLRQEYRRPGKRRLLFRLIATTIAVGSLVMLAWPVYLPKKNTRPANNVRTPEQASKNGFIACNWPQRLAYGKPLQISGRYRNGSNAAVWLQLRYAGLTQDSLKIPAQTDTTFSLQTFPPFLGPGEFELRAGKRSAPVPVEVLPVKRFGILFLAASPDFENRFLADWLGKGQQEVAMRTLVSKGKYATRFFNRKTIPIDVNAALLDQFALVIADKQALTATEWNNVNAYTRTHDLGLIIRGDSAGAGSRAVSLQLSGGERLPPIAADPALAGRSGNTKVPLVKDSAGNIYVSMTMEGAGKRLQSHINNTYTWQLAGEERAYSHYWSALINAAMRSEETPAAITLSPQLPRVNEPVTITLATTDTVAAPVVATKNGNVYLAQHLLLPGVWTGRYWPLQSGWQSFTVAGQTTHGYIYQASDWPELMPEKAEMPAATANAARKRLPLWYFALALVLSCAGLWIERKL
ncbi:hypothetical protein [Chitinophaga vietnamensis]|uniref:hypothetical protein n=1 Tax=Chitinophaga vietnamensis TaxID=2593957 RepID=UPI001177B899|nr:hypothetical protein [Chitinophaga vietnamensis]